MSGEGVAFARQGEPRLAGRFSIFRALKYAASYAPLREREECLRRADARYLEA